MSSFTHDAYTVSLSVSKLRRRYIVALSLIALLIISSQGLMQFLLADQTHDSHIINIAGRQRMLSQKITKLSYYISSNPSLQEKLRYQNELTESITLWEKSHLGLISGDIELELPGNNSNEVIDLFEHIQPHYEAMFEAANIVSSSPDLNVILQNVVYLSHHESDFLKGMNDIVFQYDRDAKAKVETAKWLEVFLMITTLLVLILEAIFIFSPAARSIQHNMQRLAEREQDLQNLFAVSPNAMLLVQPDDFSIIHANQKAQTLIAKELDNFSPINLLTYLNLDHETNQVFIDKINKEVCLNEYEVILLDANGCLFETLVSVRTTNFAGNRVLVISITNISELKKAQQKLEHFATFDEMTGLMNRRSGMLLLNNSMKLATRTEDNICVCFIDIDGLKNTNDNYGHAEGDWLINTISNTLSSVVRNSDAAIRLGGDEFLLILHNCSYNNAKQLLSDMQTQLQEIQIKSKKSFPIAFSFGITTYTAERDITVDELISEADGLMYQEKQLKKVHWY